MSEVSNGRYKYSEGYRNQAVLIDILRVTSRSKFDTSECYSSRNSNYEPFYGVWGRIFIPNRGFAPIEDGGWGGDEYE